MLQYSAAYYLAIPVILQTHEVIFTPEDNTLVSKLNFMPEEDLESFPTLEQETYKVRLKFLNVAESDHNMQQGNLYLSSKFISNLPSLKPILVNRMGAFSYSGKI